jgi:hypothetical protein
MGRLLLGLLSAIAVVSAVSALAICAREREDYWSRIEALAEKGTGHGNPQLVKYLKSLSRDQMLVAARLYCEKVQKTRPPNDWAPSVAPLMLALAFYYEEVAGVDLDKGVLKQETGALSDDSFDKLLAIIADSREVEFFRYALANMVRSCYAPHFTERQQDRAHKAITAVLRNVEVSARLRAECCESLLKVLAQGYVNVIKTDPAIRKVFQAGPPEQRRNVFPLIDSGEIKLSAQTIAQLVPMRTRIREFRTLLTEITQRDREPVELRRVAMQSLDRCGKLPLLDGRHPE